MKSTRASKASIITSRTVGNIPEKLILFGGEILDLVAGEVAGIGGVLTPTEAVSVR
jgi:hypothetical protein